MQLFDLSGQVALVTGSSRGIGKAIAHRLAEQGARVVISSRKADACDLASAEINRLTRPDATIAIPANISSKDDLAALVARTNAEIGPIDILVCNAATNTHMGSMSDISDEQFLKILSNNVLSNHWLIQMVAPAMLERRKGSITLISSIAGHLGTRVLGAYAVSKAADFQLVRNLALEFGSSDVRVNCIAPGVIKTDFARALWDDTARRERFEGDIPLGRLGDPDDIAGTAVFLASAAARYITGQTIVADGGLSVSSVIAD